MERILILAKTYPSPSAQYVETSCVAGISENGGMRRLFPVPFRMVEDGQQFKKWQWIDVRVEKANKDHRPAGQRCANGVAAGRGVVFGVDGFAWRGALIWPTEKLNCSSRTGFLVADESEGLLLISY
jgi:hypothetical protein